MERMPTELWQFSMHTGSQGLSARPGLNNEPMKLTSPAFLDPGPEAPAISCRINWANRAGYYRQQSMQSIIASAPSPAPLVILIGIDDFLVYAASRQCRCYGGSEWGDWL